MKPVMTCKYCKHSTYEEDQSVGIMGDYVCDNPAVPDDFSEELGRENEDCKFFEPIIHEKCDFCGRLMNVPLWLWDKVYHGAFADHICCSQECVDECHKREMAEFAMAVKEG